jgi:hypothetical protein
MQTTTDFFTWFFSGLNGLGGWCLFFLLALAAIIFVLYDTSRRRLAATGWKMGVILITLLLLPVIIFRFSGIDTQASLLQFKELFFYLGLLGGILPPVLAVGYFVTFRGLVGCPQGHIYEASLGQCPECARAARPIVQQVQMAPVPQSIPVLSPKPIQMPAQPVKPKVAAWLVARDGHSYQLSQGETTIGRHSTNDIQLAGDETLSRQHAKILEQNGHFRLYDLGAANGTFVNGQRLREPRILDHGDEIRFGDSTTLNFKC